MPNLLGYSFVQYLWQRTYWDIRSSKENDIRPTLFQINFWNQFSTSGSGQTENKQICMFSYFQSDHFPKSKNDSKTRFEKVWDEYHFFWTYGQSKRKTFFVCLPCGLRPVHFQFLSTLHGRECSEK